MIFTLWLIGAVGQGIFNPQANERHLLLGRKFDAKRQGGACDASQLASPWRADVLTRRPHPRVLLWRARGHALVVRHARFSGANEAFALQHVSYKACLRPQQRGSGGLVGKMRPLSWQSFSTTAWGGSERIRRAATTISNRCEAVIARPRRHFRLCLIPIKPL